MSTGRLMDKQNIVCRIHIYWNIIQLKKKEFLMYATTGMNLGNIMPSKVDQSQKDKYFAYMKGWLSGISKFIETECKIEFGGGVFLLNRYKVSDWDDAKALGKDDGGGGAFPDSSVGKESACNAGNPGLNPGSGRFSGEGIGHHSSILGLPLWLSW